ncbi:YhzD family protein [Salibacterium salarium]
MQYFLTAFASDGGTLLNEMFAFENDEEAVEYGRKRLKEENCDMLTHRMTRSGKLILFHR